MSDRRPYLSATQIGMYLRCPHQYAFRYIEGIKSPPSGAMKLGGAWHLALKHNFRQKVESKTDLPIDEMTDFFAETFDHEMQREEVILDEDQTPGQLKDQGVNITREHHRVLAPTIQPLQVEHEINVSFGKDDFSYDLFGILDLVDVTSTIRDSKSAARAPSQSDMDKDIQLSTYALLYRMSEQKAEAGLTHDTIVKGRSPRAVVLHTQRNREGLKLHLNMIGHIAKAIRAEAFPTNPVGWHCSPKFCGYWNRCMGKAMVTVDLGRQLKASIKPDFTEQNDREINRPRPDLLTRNELLDMAAEKKDDGEISKG